MTRPARSAAAAPAVVPKKRPAAHVSAPAPQAEEPATGSSAERSLRLLALLANEGRALSLADLAAQLSLPKGTAHRICAQLLATGYLARDVDERMFSVGPALRQLAFDTLNHGVVRGLRHEVLSELVRQVGETCNFTTLDGVQVLYLDRVEAQWPLRLTLDVGSHVPLHCTASGKLFLAQMEKKERDAVIGQVTLARMTANTITDAEQLRAECEAIAKRGYSTDREEFIAGLVAVAVPVFDAAGKQRAAIAVHAPTARMTMEGAIERIGALKEAAGRMAGLL
ncbi:MULTISPECIES: IclR family transcriptional regulator [unclassified Variovorax]|uniref:IclR family transcriptional regulator n=1 Tax=unclassified Variovorax TaxID=663243 RepID=UPI00076C9880|nr:MULTISPECIES: IclR family transcriptional regulator [unclassified Variovorax]KWT93457.1 Transcriptional regulator, IclR family [Variovorax sp. WDL1]PNG46769.1 Pectin degradation repressor protein KdgR [Variovorax sp. B2]PNG48580.1 Pectin degradation repressor protein KdgR [Variovorax sp. B4]VTV14574.1 Pectin degradation repressor protein KdgR [Variovorax sp. WDL1]